MNEEQLRIVIKAVTAEAQKELAKVKDKLQDIDEESKETGKTLTETMGNIKAKVAVAVAALAGLAAAYTKIGNAGREFAKTQNALISGFQAAGSTAEQAKTTFNELYGIMGDADAASEAAQSLARLTQEEKALGEYTNILTGIYATYGAGMPIETIAESITETAALGKITGDLSRALVEMGINEDAFNAALANTNSQAQREALIRQTLNGLYANAANLYRQNNASTIAYNQAQANLNAALANASKYVIPALTAFTNLAAVLLQILEPAFRAVSAVVIVFVQWIIAAAKAVGTFFGLFTDSSKQVETSTTTISTNIGGIASGVGDVADGFSNAATQAEKLKKATMGFDELNVVSDPTTSSTTGTGSIDSGIGSVSIPSITVPKIDTNNLGLEELGLDLDRIEERIKSILALIGSIGAAFAIVYGLQYLSGYLGVIANLTDVWKLALKPVLGWLLIIAGALMTIKGYSDAWVDGVDWGNLALTLGGMAVLITGIGLAYGMAAVPIAACAAAIALFTLYLNDVKKNGPTWQNSLLLLGAAIAVALALATAGVSALITIIVAAVTAIGGFIAALVLEPPAIMSVEDAQEALTEAKEAAVQAELSYANAIDASESAMKRLEEAEKAAGMTGEELYKKVQDGTLDYANMDAAQRELYKAYIDNEQKQKDLKAATEELNAAKKAETLASFDNQLALAKESGSYDDYKKAVIDAFNNGTLSAEEARDALSKSMSEMSDDAQQTFMKDIPGNIKDGLDPHKFESTWTKIKKWFSNLWQGIKDIFKDVGSWFKDIGTKAGEAISGAFKTVINWILDKIEKTINKPIQMINNAIDTINKIPGVNISKMKEISVPRLATGGIVSSATIAMVGEAGKEAVLPLENNTDWMDALADRIAARNGSSKVVLKVGEKEFGEVAVGAINNITRQTGNTPLVFA